MRVVIATKNPDKVREMGAVIARLMPGIEIVAGLDWPDVAETGASLEENALLKARAVTAATGLPAIADDTGLEVDALGGAPGVHTARLAGPTATYAENRHRLLALLEGCSDRAARFRTAIAFVDGEREVVVDGVLEGSIAREERGTGGFGYDPVFVVGGRTLAEIGEAEKNRISHRARALESLARLWAWGDRPSTLASEEGS
ncbi:MAG: RdgB/HAM1 family non-canonical purine NTP pyrophosphatase [Acidimicrobiia bacterium]|nr:MAG: RdgB/HAM1 family non-canonical purine NTP pyrophosphatase [Acidimicrobiia bacterium]